MLIFDMLDWLLFAKQSIRALRTTWLLYLCFWFLSTNHAVNDTAGLRLLAVRWWCAESFCTARPRFCSSSWFVWCDNRHVRCQDGGVVRKWYFDFARLSSRFKAPPTKQLRAATFINDNTIQHLHAAVLQRAALIAITHTQSLLKVCLINMSLHCIAAKMLWFSEPQNVLTAGVWNVQMLEHWQSRAYDIFMRN